MADDPPSILPRGWMMERLFMAGSGSPSNIQLNAGFYQVLPNAAGISTCQLLRIVPLAGPASSRRTLMEGSSESLAASAPPALPAPRMT